MTRFADDATLHLSRSTRLYAFLGVQTPFDPTHAFVSSPFFSPFTLAAIRLLLAFYSLATLLVALIWATSGRSGGSSFFPYFTELSYIGVCSYFFASGTQTLVYAVTKRRSYLLQRWPRPLQFLHSLLFSTITTFPIIVTIVFWSLLSSPSSLGNAFNRFDNISVHTLNTPFALFEILLASNPPQPWIHTLFLIILLALYLGVAYITKASQGIYVYDFLDPKKQGGLLAAYIVGIAVGAVIIFSITRGLILLRNYAIRRLLKDGEGNDSTTHEAFDEWQDVDLEAPTRKITLKTSRERVTEGADDSFETTGPGSGEKIIRSPISRNDIV